MQGIFRPEKLMAQFKAYLSSTTAVDYYSKNYHEHRGECIQINLNNILYICKTFFCQFQENSNPKYSNKLLYNFITILSTKVWPLCIMKKLLIVI